MLAAFDRTVAEIPVGLRCPAEEGSGWAEVGAHFASVREGVVNISFGATGFMAYTSEKQNPLIPRSFAVMDDICCLFQGHIENIVPLKQQYGLNKAANEVTIVIEAYRTLRDRGPYPADKVIRDLNGKFAFILFDCSSKSIFIASDSDGSVPLFWGAGSKGLIISDDVEIVKKGCGKSLAPFPKGCFFTTSGGLQSFEHPLNEVKAMPRVDSQGQVCGSTYKVDAQAKKDSGMLRVGSASNWSSHY